MGPHTLKLLNTSDAPNEILYVVEKENYIEAVDKHAIFEKPSHQTHIIYLDPVFKVDEDNGKYKISIIDQGL